MKSAAETQYPPQIMRTPANILSSVTHFWCAAYVLALLSLYTYIAGFLARSREAARPPRKTNQKHLRIQPSAPATGRAQLTVAPTN
jgi:hypothetical protein